MGFNELKYRLMTVSNFYYYTDKPLIIAHFICNELEYFFRCKNFFSSVAKILKKDDRMVKN